MADKQQELFNILRLRKIKGVGDVLFKEIINEYKTATDFFENNKLHIDHRVPEKIKKHLHDPSNSKKVEKELLFIDKENVGFWYYQDYNYPKLLKECHDAPVILFHKGNIKWQYPKIISIVGTRQATDYGKAFLNQLFEEIAPYQPIILSGYAAGIDIYAHRLAIKHQLQTIACMGTSLATTYPASHQKYNNEMLANGGFISDIWSTDDITKGNFASRNRIVAGISQATIVVESANRGGSLITADVAFRYDREVFALPGSITHKYSAGCNLLIKQLKAQLITNAQDIIKNLDWDTKEKPQKIIQQQLPMVELSEIEEKIVNYLHQKQKSHIDLISKECNIPIHVLASTLIQLEIKNMIKPLMGKYFEIL